MRYTRGVQKTKFNIDMTTYLHCMGLHNQTLIHCSCFYNMNRLLAIRYYILTRHNLVVARNTTFEDVSGKVNECFVSDNSICIVLILSIKIEYQSKTNNMGGHFLL